MDIQIFEKVYTREGAWRRRSVDDAPHQAPKADIDCTIRIDLDLLLEMAVKASYSKKKRSKYVKGAVDVEVISVTEHTAP